MNDCLKQSDRYCVWALVWWLHWCNSFWPLNWPWKCETTGWQPVLMRQIASIFRIKSTSFRQTEAPASWTLRPSLIGLRHFLFPVMLCWKWFRKWLSTTRQTTRAHHSIYHLLLVFTFQTEQPFGVSETRGDAKIKCSHHIGFGRPWLERETCFD